MARGRAERPLHSTTGKFRKPAAGRHCQVRPRAHGMFGTEAFASSVASAVFVGQVLAPGGFGRAEPLGKYTLLPRLGVGNRAKSVPRQTQQERCRFCKINVRTMT